MTKKTLSDCARCPVVTKCTAHITGGTWDHTKGPDPCQVCDLDYPECEVFPQRCADAASREGS